VTAATCLSNPFAKQLEVMVMTKMVSFFGSHSKRNNGGNSIPLQETQQ